MTFEWEGEHDVQLEIEAQTKLLFAKTEAQRLVTEKSWGAEAPEVIDSIDLEVHQPDWLLEGYLETGTVGMLIGAFGTAKSFLALDMAMHISCGKRWYEHNAAEDSVLYIASEGARGIGKRVRAWEQQHQTLEPRTMWVCPKPLSLLSPPAMSFLSRTIREKKIGMVVVDTLARSTAGANENDSQDAGLVIQSLYDMRDAWESERTTVLVVHHTGKDANKGARGSSRYGADVDFIFETSKSETDNTFTVRHRKAKDEDTQVDMMFGLKPVCIDDYGTTSCVLRNPYFAPPDVSVDFEDESPKQQTRRPRLREI